MFIFLHFISLTVRIETWIQFLSLLSLLHFSKVFISSKSSMNSSVSPAPKCKCNALYSTGYKSCFKRCVPFAVYMWNANTDWCWCSTCCLINTTPVLSWEDVSQSFIQPLSHWSPQWSVPVIPYRPQHLSHQSTSLLKCRLTCGS